MITYELYRVVQPGQHLCHFFHCGEMARDLPFPLNPSPGWLWVRAGPLRHWWDMRSLEEKERHCAPEVLQPDSADMRLEAMPRRASEVPASGTEAECFWELPSVASSEP